jgi:hypothetical protein
MGILYVARSVKLGRWASDVGLGKNVYKVGIADGDPKALAATGWAGETDWAVVRGGAGRQSARPARRREKDHDPALPEAWRSGVVRLTRPCGEPHPGHERQRVRRPCGAQSFRHADYLIHNAMR